MKRRVAAAFMAMMMVIPMLTACSSGTDDSGTDSEGGSGESYEVVVQWPSLTGAPEGLEDVEAAVNAIVEPEIGVTVALSPVNPFNLSTETSLAISGGEKIDLILNLFSGVKPNIDTGCIIPIDDLVDEYGADIREVCGDQLAGGYYDGTLYGVPIAYIGGQDQGFIARTDLLEKYNIQIDPEKIYTFDELGEMFRIVKEGEGDGFYNIAIGSASSANKPFDAYFSYDTLGGGLTGASGVLMLGDECTSTEVTDLFETEEYAEYAQTMYEWAQAGYFSPDASTATDSDQALVSSGNYMGVFNAYAAGDLSATYGQDMTFIRTLKCANETSDFQNILWSISSTSENPEKAMQFLNEIYANPDIANLLQFGIEGESYVVVEEDENGTVIDYPEGMTQETVPYWQSFGVFGDRLSWLIQAPNPTTMNQELRAFSETVDQNSPALGYSFINDSVSSQVSAVNAVIQQYIGMINTGVVDPAEELPLFINDLKAAGIDEVIAENQAQLDEWLGAQK